MRWGPISRELIEDLTQEAFLKLCGNRCELLRKTRGQPEDAAWAFIKVTVANMVHDHLRAQHAEKRFPVAGFFGSETAIHSASEGDTARSTERAVLLGQLDDILERRLTGESAARDRRVFWLHHRLGMTAKAIAAIPRLGLSDKGVESVLHRLSVLIKENLSPGKGISPDDSFS